jgi:hypothetical protein
LYLITPPLAKNPKNTEILGFHTLHNGGMKGVGDGGASTPSVLIILSFFEVPADTHWA